MDSPKKQTESDINSLKELLAAAATDSKLASQSRNVEDCKCESVIIYNDRAEVKRRVEVELMKGTQEVIILGLPTHSTEESSIRVSGTGDATILEVSNSLLDINKLQIEESEEEKKKREQQSKEIDDSKQKLQAELSRMEYELKWVDGYASQMMLLQKDGKHLSVEDATNFLQFYSSQLKKFDDKKSEIHQKIDELNAKQSKVKPPVKKADPKKEAHRRQVFILTHSKMGGKVSFQLSYIVRNAHWVPQYDIRVTNKQKTAQLVYYGAITNFTEDNWANASLSLSTAVPSIAGNPPSLTTLRVYEEYPQENFKKNRSNTFSLDNDLNNNPLYSPALNSLANPLYGDMPPGGAGGGNKPRELVKEPVAVLTSTVEQGTTSATFKIPRETTIDSDGKPHKVTIAILDLSPTFTHTTIPKLSQYAYLRALCVNSTDFPLLEGKMNIFMDNNFVSTSVLKKTNTKDELSLFLGVDPEIVVEYKEEIFNETRGIISKTKTINYKHITSIKNTKSSPIEISVFDQLPLSAEEKIKVNVLKPNLKDENNVILNEFNNIRWSVKLNAGEKQDILYHYTIDFPKDKEIRFSK